jgi:hypothetical protein
MKSIIIRSLDTNDRTVINCPLFGPYYIVDKTSRMGINTFIFLCELCHLNNIKVWRSM